MASYGEYCPLSKALDVVGDRWTLLIVRELLIQGALRYSEIQYGLPGIATNLLANRLRALEEAGIVRKHADLNGGKRFALTHRGKALRPVLFELGRWGMPLMEKAPITDAFRMHWIAPSVETSLQNAWPRENAIAIQLYIGDQAGVLESHGSAMRLREGVADSPDVVLRGSAWLVYLVLFKQMTLAAARKRGLKIEGRHQVLKGLRPKPVST